MNTGQIAAGLSFALVITCPAKADVVDMQFLGIGEGRDVSVTTPSGSMRVFAGQLRQRFSNGTGSGAQLQGELITYCTDLTQGVPLSTQHFDLLPLQSVPVGGEMGMDKARAIASLYDYALGVQLTGDASKDLACAFQIAVWEVVTDFNYSLGASSLDVTSGNFMAAQIDGRPLTPGVSSLLQDLFFNTGNSSFVTTGLAGVASSQFQDQIVTIPAPASLALAGSALGLTIRRRRRA